MTIRKSRNSTQPVTNPARSLNARRTNVAAPPVSGIAAVPSAYESETRTNTAPVDEQDERRQPERDRGDDAERDVQRRRDLAVRDGEERRGVENALEPAELARHSARASSARV